MFGVEPVMNGTSDKILEQFGAKTKTGRELRKHDARRKLEEIDLHEREVNNREQTIETSKNRIDALMNQHRLDAEYIISFGVPVDLRNEYRMLLSDIVTQGHLSLKQAQHQINVEMLNS